MRVKFGGTIPVAEYANIMPEFEAEGPTFEAAVELGLGQMKTLWDRVGRKPLEIDKSPKGILKTCWASGTEVFFDPVEHVYQDVKGHKYLGGSTFAHRFTKEFPAQTIAGKMATKHGADADEIRAMWQLNSEASTTVGTAVHAALELRQKYGPLSQQVKDGSFESATTGNPILRPIVEAFFTEERMAENALAEVFVADSKRHHAGLIDRMIILGEDRVKLQDYKTSKDVFKEASLTPPFKDLVPANQLGIFTIQLNFYRRILETHGKTVEALEVLHWDGKAWVPYVLELLDLDEIMRKHNE